MESVAQTSELAADQVSARFSLGIDLGTSNSAAAVEDFETGRAAIVEITQLLGPNRIGEEVTLPSAIYVHHADEFPEDVLRIPCQVKGSDPIIGHFVLNYCAYIHDNL